MNADVAYFLFVLAVEFLAPVLIVVGVIWGIFFLLRMRREAKSFAASKGDAAAMAAERLRLKARGLEIASVLLFAATLLVVGFLAESASWGFFAAVIVSGVVMLLARRAKGEYNASFKDGFVRSELSRVFDNLEYAPGGGFDKDAVRGLGFFSSADSVDDNDLIVADYRGKHFSQCDLGVRERYTVTVRDNDGNSRTETRWRDVFRGRAMRFDFAEKFRGRVQVVSRDFTGAGVGSAPGEWRAVETELAEFREHYAVFAVDPLDAMAVLTPQMIEGIFYIRKAFDLPTAFYFTGSTMYVFIVTERETFDVSAKKTLLEERALLTRDIALVTGFLDIMYFKPQEAADAAGTAGAEKTIAERAAEAAAVAAAAGPSEAEKLARGAKRAAGKAVGFTLSWLPLTVIAVFLVSAVYAMSEVPDGLRAGASYSNGEWSASGMTVPTLGYLIVGGIFIVVTAFASPLISILLLATHLLFLSVNI